MTDFEKLELPLTNHTIYKTNCGCEVELINQLDNRGKHMKNFFMGMWLNTCIDHMDKKNVKHKWGINGQHKGSNNSDKKYQALDLWYRIERNGNHPAPVR